MTSIRRATPRLALVALSILSALTAGCGGGGASASSPSVTVQGDVPIAYAKRARTITLNPTDAAPTAAGGDLIIREKASPSAPEHNITTQFTLGLGDVSRPEVSWDGKKIIFSMRCPSSNAVTINGAAACTGRWNIWEYDMSSGGLTGGSFRRLTASTSADDIDPAYLPGGQGFVFTSNRQTTTYANQALGRSYYALDEYERQRVFNLHTMDADGGNIKQISVNQSHDRSPVVRQNGEIMFSRWDHVGDRNHFKIFRIKPDGTDLFVLYGAHSDGNTFLHPREMDPTGKYAGQVTADVMPLSRTSEGGALLFVDLTNYSEQDTPANSSVPATGGQVQPMAHALSMDRGLSRYGRITSPFPLWDGTNRVLLAYTPCQATRNGVVVSCAELSTAEWALLTDTSRTNAQKAGDAVQADVPAAYSIYMYDPVAQTMLQVAAPADGFIYTDPVAIAARTEPAIVQAASLDSDMATRGVGMLEVRSVYDTDGLGRMGDAVLTAADLGSGCTTAIAKTTPTDSSDTRAQVADLVRMKNPADSAYGCAPARFIRAVRAVAPPSGMTGLRAAIGLTNFEPQQILGYAPIEPDGSFKLEIPADTPIGLAVVDAQGRAFQTHTNWIQVRPGERRTCDGCHSPRRGASLNSGSVVNTMPAALNAVLSAAHASGETMAATRTRLDPTLLQLQPDMVFTDVWADTTKTGVTARSAIAVRYTGNASSADDLVTAVPTNGVINYETHIQPLWTRSRGTDGAWTCTGCHNASDTLLNLSGTRAATSRLASYENLMTGLPMLDANGQPVTELEEGVPVIKRHDALVATMASEGNALGLARQSRLTELLWGQTLMASTDARTQYPAIPSTAPDHTKMLNAAERRLLAEWMDLGGKYFNDPFDPSGNVRAATGLSNTVFTSTIHPLLLKNCSNGCHMAIGSSKGSSFQDNRFVLTGDDEGDYDVTLTLINDVCSPASSPLLSRPSTIPHPAANTSQKTALLPVGSDGYNSILSWISASCTTSP